jgi:CheY-specific phosphatase CheX
MNDATEVLPSGPVDAETFATVLKEAATELLGLYGVRLRPLEPDEPRGSLNTDDLVAILPFAGPRLSGQLLLAGSEELVARTLPSEDLRTEEFLLDWAGELANQVLGRVKERLLRRGADLDVDTPTVYFGHEAPFGLLDPFSTVGHMLRHDASEMFVCFEVHAEDGFRLTDDPTPPHVGHAGRRLL